LGVVSSTTNARILIVDDDELSLRALRRTLSAAGYDDVHASTAPATALEEIRELEPALVVLDLNMPGVDGFEVLARLRESDAERRIWRPVLVLTGDSSASARHQAWTLGATDFVNKPVDSVELVLRIENILRAYQLQQQVADHNALLERQVRQRTEEIELAHAEVLVRLALAAEFRDDETGAHTWRVGKLTALLAEVVGVDSSRLKLIERATRLHDVGKIGIPDAVLLKPGRFDEEERAVMKRHSTIGARLLSNGRSEVLRLAEAVARGHHERWDGSGYPDGLVGEAIPFECRLAAVADVFDALTHTRSYKDPWPLERAVEEIESQRGVQFEPTAVDAFLELVRQDRLGEIERPEDAKFKSILPEA